ncbi:MULTISPECIES: LLM class flavin-dependent oxidoreductase [Mycolicibacterium]|uniref:Coenzyme F420-dependent N5 N10-methylene tetrahydromethanopterin reductase and related flavin-dependent oxidoreductases-like protein n=2 Tax=unclassified Mycobacterium TaxID=2642494 RepID=A0A5Q5BMZ8_MYCSS|nr:LLM class flavin-dependent oxidoreductase [Mycolicibacterium monacense]OBB70705.1 5,10-methylene tetrahydromethanopterin reductase [Mycolicibacterium monacense]
MPLHSRWFEPSTPPAATTRVLPVSGYPRFGVWANVHGTMAALSHPDDPVNASWSRVRDQILLVEQAQGIEEISGGRFAVNIVNAWWVPDLERSGIGMLEHGERYVYGAEWLHIVRRLLAGERTTFHGKYFHVDDFHLHPTGTHRTRPRIYLGGESGPARDLAAAEADVLFLNGQAPEEAVTLLTDVRRRPRHGLDPIRFGLAAFVVTAPTQREAAELLDYHWELNARDRAGDGDTIDRFSRDTDPASVMWQRLRERPHIGPNGGTAAGLVGDYDTVAQRIVEWHRLGIETFMLAFQPFEAEMQRFAAEIMPRVQVLSQRAEVAV